VTAQKTHQPAGPSTPSREHRSIVAQTCDDLDELSVSFDADAKHFAHKGDS
jgi:hypothetical protein